MKDDDIVKLMRARDIRGVEKLIDKYGRYVSSAVRRTVLPALTESDVEELCADVFAAAWQEPDRLPPEKLKQYLSAAARNMAVSRLRRTRELVPLDDEYLAADDGFESEIDRLLTAQELNSALAELSADDRGILVSAYYYCRKISDIAKRLGISENAAKTRLCRARGRLKKILEVKGFISR